MEIKLLADNVDNLFISTYKEKVKSIYPSVKQMLIDKGVSFVIVDHISDLPKSDKPTDYNYDLNLQKESRGLMSDEKNLIAISYKNTRIEDIDAILHHELGHFIDIYENYGKIDSLCDMTFSSDKRFIEAYTEDFKTNWSLIKEDKNRRLIHFVQNSTPENIHPTAIMETFAELFRHANEKINDTKTVELYFQKAHAVLKELVEEKGYLNWN